MDRREITEEEIKSQKTDNGGWTRDVLAQWGVSWPPKKGWKADLLKNGAPIAIDEFEAAPRYSGSGRLLSPEDVSRLSLPESSK